MLAWDGLACGGAPGEPAGAADVGASETSVGAVSTSAGTSSTGAGETSTATPTTGVASTDAADESESGSESGGAPTDHEPEGMIVVGPGANPMDVLPPQVPAVDPWGQQYYGDQLGGNLEVVVDPAAPFPDGTYYRVHFPVGFGGGDAPARWNLAGNFPDVGGEVRRLYCSFWIRYSESYDSGSKLFFFSQEPPNNHYFILANGEGDSFEMVIQNQGYNFERVADDFNELRTWNFIEFYIETGSPGASDGVGRVWVNGELRLENEAFSFFAADAAARWTNLWMDPTYGGPAGEGEYFDIGHVYTSVGA